MRNNTRSSIRGRSLGCAREGGSELEICAKKTVHRSKILQGGSTYSET